MYCYCRWIIRGGIYWIFCIFNKLLFWGDRPYFYNCRTYNTYICRIFFILGLYVLKELYLQIIFIIVFIFSIIGWSFPIYKYNLNIEKITLIILESTEERQLLYFCNIPVQETSGGVSGSFHSGSGNVFGDIATSDKLPYWYLNENGDGNFDYALPTSSKLIFIDDIQSPYVEIFTYSTQKISKNHNNGT